MIQIQLDNIGTAFILTILDQNGDVVPLQAATLKQIRFEKPRSTGNPRATLVKTAAFPPGDDGSEGRIQYVSVAGDLDTIGDWLVQGYIEEGTSPIFHTSKEPFEVLTNVGAKY